MEYVEEVLVLSSYGHYDALLSYENQPTSRRIHRTKWQRSATCIRGILQIRASVPLSAGYIELNGSEVPHVSGAFCKSELLCHFPPDTSN